MKKLLVFLLLLPSFIRPAIAQHVNIDSIIKVVCARNPRRPDNYVLNRDSLFKRLPLAKPGKERINLIFKMLISNGDVKQNTEIGYRILAWAKTNHDDITQAVIAAELGTELYNNGDKASASKLEMEAMDAANVANDDQTFGIVYQDAFARAGVTRLQERDYQLKALKYSMAANDPIRICWEYMGLRIYYHDLKKLDSAYYYTVKALDWAVRSNSIFDICDLLPRVAAYGKDKEFKEKCLRAAFNIANYTNLASAVNVTASHLSDSYLDINIDTAYVYARIAQQKAQKLAISAHLAPASLLYQIYKKKRNIDSIDKYINLYYDLYWRYENNEGVINGQAANFAEKEKQEQAATMQRLWLLGIASAFLLSVALIFWINNRRTHKANALLAKQKQQTEQTLAELKNAQVQLIQSEKMASLGELTAGIAHEIQNPLNFVNNFSEVNREMLDELDVELKAGNVDEARAIANDIRQNEEKISHHGKRADFIVKGMLQHSRTGTGEKQPTNINVLADEFMKLSYHGLRAKDKDFNAELTTHFSKDLPKVNIVQQDIGRVLLNLFNNAFYAVNEKSKTAGADYKPEVTLTTALQNNQLLITVRDNGIGIPNAIKDKIMQPFFTTKPTGQGTGLGLSLSYDIVVKGHGGQFTVDSREGEFTEFVVAVPIV